MYAVIDGGVPPVGRVRVSGAKNSATRLLAAALLTDDSVELSNFPTRLVDVGHKVKFCRDIGAEVTMDDVAETITIDSASLKSRLLSAISSTYLSERLTSSPLDNSSGRASRASPTREAARSALATVEAVVMTST